MLLVNSWILMIIGSSQTDSKMTAHGELAISITFNSKMLGNVQMLFLRADQLNWGGKDQLELPSYTTIAN